MQKELDFLSEQSLLYTSKEYEDIYIHLGESLKLAYHELFILFASIGAKYGRKDTFTERGREMRTNYFNRDQRDLAYSIILNDNEIGKNIENFSDSKFFNQGRKLLESYAQAGAAIAIEEVFKAHWDGRRLNRDYKEYELDLLTYVYSKLEEVPF